jgi:hypothetical protein
MENVGSFGEKNENFWSFSVKNGRFWPFSVPGKVASPENYFDRMKSKIWLRSFAQNSFVQKVTKPIYSAGLH